MLAVAPESGWVTEKSVVPGEYVQAGQSLFALVPKQVFITANFKEDQIRRMRPGQPVEIEVDALQGRKFRGHVDSIQAGRWSSIQSAPSHGVFTLHIGLISFTALALRSSIKSTNRSRSSNRANARPLERTTNGSA